MKTYLSTLTLTAAAALLAVPASAHVGDHSPSFLQNVLHWVSSPTHALFAVIGSAAVIALVLKIKSTRS